MKSVDSSFSSVISIPKSGFPAWRRICEYLNEFRNELRFEGGGGSGDCGGGERDGRGSSSEGWDGKGEDFPDPDKALLLVKKGEDRPPPSDSHSRGVIVPAVVGVGAREPFG